MKIMLCEDGSESWAFNDMLQTCYLLGTLIETATVFDKVNRSVLELGPQLLMSSEHLYKQKPEDSVWTL